MSQKLISIFFHSDTKSNKLMCGDTDEHLSEYMEAGWIVKSVTPIGAGVGQAAACASGGSSYRDLELDIPGYVSGWALVLLEKP